MEHLLHKLQLHKPPCTCGSYKHVHEAFSPLGEKKYLFVLLYYTFPLPLYHLVHRLQLQVVATNMLMRLLALRGKILVV